MTLYAVLHARMFSYPDAARYRLGVNYQMLPTNRAKVPIYCPFERDGFMNFTDNYGADPNYVGSQLQPTSFKTSTNGGGVRTTITEHERWAGEISSYTSEIGPLDFEQATMLWDVIGREPGHQARTLDNLAHNISGVTNPKLRLGVYGM